MTNTPSKYKGRAGREGKGRDEDSWTVRTSQTARRCSSGRDVKEEEDEHSRLRPRLPERDEAGIRGESREGQGVSRPRPRNHLLPN